MTELSAVSSKYPLKTVLWAGLLVGTLDITAASTQYLIVTGKNPVSILVYIASGVFGQQAFDSGTAMAPLGLLFHYFIAYSWTALFFALYPRLAFMTINWIATGFGYGFFIWLMMSRVVVQLSNTPKGPFNLRGAIIGCLILIAMIGLPLSYIAAKRSKSTGA